MCDINILGRFGGEEFFIIMLDASEKKALMVAKRIRYKYENVLLYFTKSLSSAQLVRVYVIPAKLEAISKTYFSLQIKRYMRLKKEAEIRWILFSSFSKCALLN